MAGEHGEGDFLILEMMPVTFIVAASALSMIVVSLMTQAPDAAHVDRFFVTTDRKKS